VDVWESPHTMVMPGWVRPRMRGDDVDDALVLVTERVQPDAELGRVLAQRVDLQRGDRVGDRQRGCSRWGCCGPRWPIVRSVDAAPDARRGEGRRTPAGW
jgi:hypothetical protein